MNQLYIAIPFLQFVLSLFLAALVFFSDATNRRNRLFVVFLVAMALWGVTIFGMRDAFPDPVRAYAWEKIVLAIVPFTGIVFYHFVIEYARIERRRTVLVAFYATGTVSAVFSVLGYSVYGMTETFYGFAPVLGWAFPFILIAAYPPVALALYDLTRARRTTLDRDEAVRLQLLRIGVIVSLLGGTTDFLPSLGLNIYPMGVLGNLIFAAITSWAVMHHGLMNLRLALRRGAAYMVMSSAVFGVYGAIYGLL
jgi:hypothetical protein